LGATAFSCGTLAGDFARRNPQKTLPVVHIILKFRTHKWQWRVPAEEIVAHISTTSIWSSLIPAQGLLQRWCSKGSEAPQAR
jgi:hypothetical protein